MKSIVISIVLFCCSVILIAQSEEVYYFTKIFPSPTGNKVIIVECSQSDYELCVPSIITERLYNVPFDCDKYITLNNLIDPQWDSQGIKIFITKPIEGFQEEDTFVKTIIEIYDTNGFIFDTIMYASSPISRYGELFFCREYDPVSKAYYPQVFKYNLETKKETLVHRFDSVYTFWSPQFDCILYPEIKFNSTYPHGIVCVLHNKDNPEVHHTAVIDPGIMNVVLWKEGYHYDCMTKE